MIRKKILLLGDFHVGKTSLIRRYVDNSFDDSYLTTIGVKISKKEIALEGEIYELLIWDIEGATPHKAILQNYLRGASGAIFVADVVRDETVEGLLEHIENFLSVNPEAPYVVAYNKADLLTSLQYDSFELDDRTFLVSAKDDLNVEKLFVALAKRIFR